jgi:trigger factor
MADITVVKTAEDSGSKALQVTVPVDRVRAAESRAVRFFSARVRLPGFRKGKAPEGVVRKRFQQEIRERVLQDVIREGWDAAREAEALKPVTDPAVRNLRFEDGQPVEFELVVEVKPAVTIARAGGFTVTRTVAPVTDTMVQEHLDRLREQKATWIPVEGEKPSAGRLVTGEVTSLEDGAAAEPKPFSMVLGEGQAVPALEEQLMQMAPGETIEADLRIPEDHPDPARRGATRRVRVSLHEVKRQELPPLDDAFAGEVGPFESLEALRAAIREDLAREAGREADARVREELVNLVAEANNVQAPPSMVERALHVFMQAYQVPEDQREGFWTQFRPVAARQVRRDLVLGAVAEQEGLRTTEAELDERIARIAEARGVAPAEVYRSLEQGRRLPELERSITEEKVFAWLLTQSTVTEAAS